MSVRRANQDRIGGDVGLRGDALADVVGDANAEREQVNADDRDLARAIG